MAYVISVCGAGGKTTYIYERAHEYLKQNKKVAVLTTTKMYYDRKLSNIDEVLNKNILSNKEVFTFGNVKNNHITPVSDEEYKKICDAFDIVIIEADGSRCMPVKIPDVRKEPVIKDNTDEIVLVYSPFAYDRKISIVCFRYDEYKNDKFFLENNINENIILNKDLIENIYNEFYENQLFDKNINHTNINLDKVDKNKIKFTYYTPDLYKYHNEKNYNNITLTLLCAGSSSRFDPINHENKLMVDFCGKPLYKYMYNLLIDVRKKLIKEFKNLGHNINIDINIIVNENNIDEITHGIFDNKNEIKQNNIINQDNCIENIEDNDNIRIILNKNFTLGLSSSVKIATEYNINKDAICFFNADMPLLKVRDITNMIKNTIISNTHNGCMVDSEGVFKNPAIFYKKYFDEILKIQGDKGPKDILNKYEYDTYKYHIDDESLIDIDTKEKFKEIINNFKSETYE